MKKYLKNFVERINVKIIAMYLIVLVATTISTTSVAFILGAHINSMYLVFNILLSFLIIHLVYKKDYSNKIILTNVIYALLVFSLLVFISLLFYDGTWDGNVYHKQMIGLMKNGMNPVYNVESGDIWAQHYSNGCEIFAAVLYSFFNDIESGKVINLILAFVLSIFSYQFVYKKSNKRGISLLFSLAIAFNPLILSQFNTYYIDGTLANSLFLSIIALINFIDDDFKFKDKTSILLFISSSIVCINSKFTALLIWGLFLCLLGGYTLIVNLKRKDYKTFKKFILLGALTMAFSVLIVGSSSYVKNFVQHKNPFYPLMGEGAVDIKTGNESVGLEKYSHTEKWLYTTFSKTYTGYDRKPELKIPFKVSRSEIYAMGIADTRVAGLGAWYSGLLCLSVPVILIGIIYFLRKKSKWGVVITLLTIGIFAPIPIFPVVWQARYYPSLYLVPFLAIMILIKADKKVLKTYMWIVVLSAIINSALALPMVFVKFKDAREINNQLVRLAEISLTKKVIISQDYFTFYGTYYNYIDKGIKYTYQEERLEDGTSLYYGTLYKIVED